MAKLTTESELMDAFFAFESVVLVEKESPVQDNISGILAKLPSKFAQTDYWYSMSLGKVKITKMERRHLENTLRYLKRNSLRYFQARNKFPTIKLNNLKKRKIIKEFYDEILSQSPLFLALLEQEKALTNQNEYRKFLYCLSRERITM